MSKAIMCDSINGWPIIQYSIQGKRHQQDRMPCQDACGCCTVPKGWTLVAIADGVSSSPHSEEASSAAICGLCDFWREFIPIYKSNEEMRTALEASFNYALRVSKEFPQVGEEPGSHETTLSAALISPEGKMYCMHVGDGGIWVVQQDGMIECLTESMRDQEGSVTALSDGPASWSFFSLSIAECLGVFMVTDGVQDLIVGNDIDRFRAIIDYGFLYTKNKMLDTEQLEETVFAGIDDDITVSTIGFQDLSNLQGGLFFKQDGQVFAKTPEKTQMGRIAALQKKNKPRDEHKTSPNLCERLLAGPFDFLRSTFSKKE